MAMSHPVPLLNVDTCSAVHIIVCWSTFAKMSVDAAEQMLGGGLQLLLEHAVHVPGDVTVAPFKYSPLLHVGRLVHV